MALATLTLIGSVWEITTMEWVGIMMGWGNLWGMEVVVTNSITHSVGVQVVTID